MRGAMLNKLQQVNAILRPDTGNPVDCNARSLPDGFIFIINPVRPHNMMMFMLSPEKPEIKYTVTIRRCKAPTDLSVG